MRTHGMIAILATLMLLSTGAICILSDEDSSADTETISGSLTKDPGESVSKTLSASKMTVQRNSTEYKEDNGVASTVTYTVDFNSGVVSSSKSITPVVTFSGTAPTEPGTYVKIVTVGLKTATGSSVLAKCQFKLTIIVNEPKATYTVSFNVDGGTSCNPMDVQEGSSITLPSTSRTDYKFEGWYENNKKVGDAGTSYKPTSNVTLYALWTSTVVTSYAVTFESNGGSQCAMQTVSKDSPITLPNTSKTGCTFLGWYKSDGTEAGDAGGSYTPEGSITLYAKWSQIAQYKVSFNTDGGTIVDTKVYDAGTEITLPYVQKANSSFVGWFTSEGVEVKSPYKVVGDITLYAHWSTYEVTISSPSEDYQFSTTLRSNGSVVTDVSGVYNWYLDGANVQNSTLSKYQAQGLTVGQHTIKVVVEVTSVSPSVTIQNELTFTVEESEPTPEPPPGPEEDDNTLAIVAMIIAASLALIAISRII